MRFSELERAVEEQRLHGERDWMQHSGEVCGIEIRTRNTKDSRRFPRDIRITLYVHGVRYWWTWPELVNKAGLLACDPRTRSVLYQCCTQLWSDADLEEVLTLTEALDMASDWERLVRMAQAMALCEERRYGDRGERIRRVRGQLVVEPMLSNGWWTPFHLLRCVSLGSDPAHVSRVAASMKGEEDPLTGERMNARPIGPEDCAICHEVGLGQQPVCQESCRPWTEEGGRRMLRLHYGDASNEALDWVVEEAAARWAADD